LKIVGYSLEVCIEGCWIFTGGLQRRHNKSIY
jgi:hypothetical protein